jgi:exodeoxyribonuclease VII small subunit
MGKEKPNPTFEQALGRLEKLVEQIESGQIGLEESIARYEEGIRLIQQCRAILDAAEKRIQLLAKGEGGGLAPAGELEPAGEEGAEDEVS